MAVDNIPQQAAGLEKQILGYCLLNAGPVEDLRLTADMFYVPAHQTIFRAILECNLNGGCDIGTVTQYLRDKGTLEEAGGVIPLTKLLNVPSPGDQVLNHARIIEQKHITREAWEIFQKASGRCESAEDIADIIDDVKENLTNLIPDQQDSEQFRVDLIVEPQPAPALLYLRNNDKLIPSFTLQNFSLITGKAKSRKTFLTVLIVASYLGYKNAIIHADHERKGTVIFIDTEQSPYHLHRMMKRICELIRVDNPDRLQAYGLKTLTPEEKKKFIEHKIRTNPDITLVVIDGIRDLVYDINSPDEATKTSVWLMKLCASHNIHILNVLHQNKGDANARGHLGSELTNKAETVLSVNLDGDKTISTVECEYSREQDFSTFSFSINEESLPEICGTPEEDKTIKRVEPHFISNDKHYQVLEKVFKDQKERKYKEACTDIKLVFAESGVYFGENRSRDYLAYYIKEGWVSKDENNKAYKYERATF
jgi:hypothetical protein